MKGIGGIMKIWKVCKFGGSSLADANQIRKVMKIIRSDLTRRYIVVSAPGKRHAKDTKVTDLLYAWHKSLSGSTGQYGQCDVIEHLITNRFKVIIKDLGIKFNLTAEMQSIRERLYDECSADFIASRGEYLMGKILAKALGFEFVDPADCIRLDENRNFSGDYSRLGEKLDGRNVVIPGFYGHLKSGEIMTFTRGGSDISGAIVARAVIAEVYENWTDVSGILMTDPRLVKNPRKIDVMTYDELRELSYMGASVFHSEATLPVQDAGIPTNIRNTNDPENPGTMVLVKRVRKSAKRNACPVTGIAGMKDFFTITTKKKLMNQEIGFVRKMLTVIEENQISFEHPPSSIDSASIIIDGKYFKNSDGSRNEELLEKVILEIDDVCKPDSLKVSVDLALIAVVGENMFHTPGVVAKVATALARKKINIRVLNQCPSETNIIIGVGNHDYENAVRAIYAAFVK